MKKNNNKIVFNKNLFYMFLILLAGIILIGLIIYDLKNTDTFSEDKKKNILYIEIFLSFIASSVLLLWMTYFLRGDFIPPLFIIIYSLVLILTTPFSLLIIRSFLQNKSYIKFISILTIISTLFSMYFTYSAAMH